MEPRKKSPVRREIKRIPVRKEIKKKEGRKVENPDKKGGFLSDEKKISGEPRKRTKKIWRRKRKFRKGGGKAQRKEKIGREKANLISKM